MDLLCQRYASPFFLLDKMIQQGRLLEFVIELNQIEDDKKLWDIWLYRVYDKSFDDWKKTLQIQTETVSESEIEATVTNSINILNGFNPNDGR